MAEEPSDYKRVIEDLKAKRAAIDNAIAVLEQIRGSDLASVTVPPVKEEPASRSMESDSFVGMSITQAAETYLRMAGKPARNLDDIVSALQKGGVPAFARDSVATLLKRAAAKSDGTIVKVGRGTWGLAEWYPNRPRKSIKRKDTVESNGPEGNEGQTK